MKKFAALIILGVMVLSIAFGQIPPALSTPTNTANKPLTTVHELTAVDVETFLDGIVPLQLDREDIAGATVAVVKDEKPLFTKGYSYADVKNKKPVTAETLMPSMSGRAIDPSFGGNFRRRCLHWLVSACSG